MYLMKKGMPVLFGFILAASLAAPAGHAKAACGNLQSCGGLSIQSILGNQNCTGSCNSSCTPVQTFNNVTCIDANTFTNCTQLKNVTVPNCVKNIGNCAFNGCSNLSTVTLGANTAKIGNNAFKNCDQLKTINIKSKKLNSNCISDNAFKGVGKDVTVNVPKDKVKSYKSLFQKKGLCKQAKVCGKF